MFEDYHKAIVRRFFDTVLNDRDLGVVNDIFGSHPLLAAATEATAATYHREIPDIRFTIDALIADGDRVAACWTARGTPVIIWQEATHRDVPVVITGVYVFRIAEGNIVGLRPHTTWPTSALPGYSLN